MMIDAPFGQSGVLIFPMNVITKRSIGIEASHGLRGRRVDISLGKGWRGVVMDREGRGGYQEGCRHCGESQRRRDDMVREEEKQGVGERSGGSSARVRVGVAVTEGREELTEMGGRQKRAETTKRMSRGEEGDDECPDLP